MDLDKNKTKVMKVAELEKIRMRQGEEYKYLGTELAQGWKWDREIKTQIGVEMLLLTEKWKTNKEN